MLSVAAKAEQERLFAEQKSEQPIEVSRAGWEDDVRRTHVVPPEVRLTPAELGGVAVEWTDCPGADRSRVLLWLHGGGYVNGSPRTHRRLAAHLGFGTGMRVVVPDYRLAPEHPFPAGVDDALAVYRALLTSGVAAGDIVLGGDSAGGGLAVSLLLLLREAGDPMPQATVLLSPWTDLTLSSPSYETNRARDPIIARERLSRAAGWYAGTRPLDDPAMSTMFAALDGLPPTLIHVGSEEAMLDDSVLLAARAEAAGIAVSLRQFAGLWHVFHLSEIPESRQAIDEIGSYLRALQGE